MNNQLIGTAGVFTTTFLLFVLRQVLLSIGRTNKDRQIQPITANENLELGRSTSAKNSWPAWKAPSETIGPGRFAPTSASAANADQVQRSISAVRDR